MRVAGISPGGVLLPGQRAPAAAGSVILTNGDAPFRPEEGGGWWRPREPQGHALEEHEPFPDAGHIPLPAESAYFKEQPPLSWVSWCKADSLMKTLGMRSDCLFVIPLVAQIATIIDISYKGSQFSMPGERLAAWLGPAPAGAVEIIIGFSPNEPELGESFTQVNSRNFEYHLPSGSVYVQGDPFAGGVSGRIPAEWRASPYPLDCLQVGLGNYNPATKLIYDKAAPAGNYMMPYAETVRKAEETFRRAGSVRKKEILEGRLSLLNPATVANKQLLKEFLSTTELWIAWERAPGELEEWLRIHEPIMARIAAELVILREEVTTHELEDGGPIFEEINTLTAEQVALEEEEGAERRREFETYNKYAVTQGEIKDSNEPTFVGDFYRVGLNDEQELLREMVGPYRLGIRKWAYRFKWDRPPHPLPDLSTTKGFFIVEVRGQPGTRWPYSEEGTRNAFEVQNGPPILGAGRIATDNQQLGAVPS